VNVASSVDDAIWQATTEIMEVGHESAPRGAKTRELTMYSFCMPDPRQRITTIRPIRLGYCAGKVAWDLAERDDVEGLVFFNPIGKQFADDGEHVQGENYGQRYSGYLDEAIQLLRKDIDSRRVWVPIWHGKDMLNRGSAKQWNHHMHEFPSRSSSNVPCTIGFGLRIIDGRLVMQVVMRSNAIIGVFPYDVFLFTTLQELIANELEVPLGGYEHVMLSAHVYEREFPVARQILDRADWPEARPMDPIPNTLSSARLVYPMALEAATGGRDFEDNGDPIIRMMLEQARIINNDEEAA
jgi:thymidylate synthase